MISMVERVARAIEDVVAPSVRYFGDNVAARVRSTGDILYEGRSEEEATRIADAWFMQARARAAIEAMREPTEAMLSDGLAIHDWDHGLADVYTAMIDAALAEKQD